MTRMLKHILAVGLSLWVGTSALAQFAAPEDFMDKGSRHLVVDWAAFRAEDSSLVRLELYYQIFNKGLEFKAETDRSVAEYELVISLRDKDDVRLESAKRDRQIVVPSSEQAKSRYDFRTSLVSFDLPQGKYKIGFTLLDKVSGKVANRELEVELKDYWAGTPTMSTVEFVQAFRQKADSGDSVFDKQDLVVVPSVTRLFGGDESERMAYYIELYPAHSDTDKVVLETKIRKLYGSMVYRDTLHVTIEGAPVRQLREVSLQHLTPGEYDMEVLLLGRRSKDYSGATYRFEVLWTQEGMIRNDWTTTIKQLDLIAEQGELEEWERLETFEAREQAYRQFWVDRDPTVGTAANEVMLEFYHRISVANHSFGMPRREGWRTDRGRVFIQFGQPDQVDDEPFAPNTYPYQVWHYYNEGRYRRFLFVDEREDGDYRLQFPYDGLNQRPDF